MDQQTILQIFTEDETNNQPLQEEEIDLINFQTTTPTISQSLTSTIDDVNNQHLLDADFDQLLLTPQQQQQQQQHNINITCDQLIDYPIILCESVSDNEITIRRNQQKYSTLPINNRKKLTKKRSKSLTKITCNNYCENLKTHFRRATTHRATISGSPQKLLIGNDKNEIKSTRSKSLTKITYPNSSSSTRKRSLIGRNHPFRNTVILRPRFKRSTPNRATIAGFPSAKKHLIGDEEEFDEVIDWNWVYKMEEQNKLDDEPCAPVERSWLRTSMRRLKHFQIPDEVNDVSNVPATVITSTNAGSMVMPAVTMGALRTTHITTTIHNNRPISAPTRLGTEVRRSVRRGRGVSAEGAGGDHGRSSSESSRVSNSRRHSVNSSIIDDSSIYDDDYDESSEGTSPSYTPAGTSPDIIPTVETTAERR